MDLKCFDVIGFVTVLKRAQCFLISAGGVFTVKRVHREVCGLSASAAHCCQRHTVLDALQSGCTAPQMSCTQRHAGRRVHIPAKYNQLKGG